MSAVNCTMTRGNEALMCASRAGKKHHVNFDVYINSSSPFMYYRYMSDIIEKNITVYFLKAIMYFRISFLDIPYLLSIFETISLTLIPSLFMA